MPSEHIHEPRGESKTSQKRPQHLPSADVYSDLHLSPNAQTLSSSLQTNGTVYKTQNHKVRGGWRTKVLLHLRPRAVCAPPVGPAKPPPGKHSPGGNTTPVSCSLLGLSPGASGAGRRNLRLRGPETEQKNGLPRRRSGGDPQGLRRKLQRAGKGDVRKWRWEVCYGELRKQKEPETRVRQGGRGQRGAGAGKRQGGLRPASSPEAAMPRVAVASPPCRVQLPRAGVLRVPERGTGAGPAGRSSGASSRAGREY